MTGTQIVEKVYSSDKKIWIGMKTIDAYKSAEDIKVFCFADKNHDGEISKKELDRYNGPLLEDNGTDYYPGLKIEDVSEPEEKKVFNSIDCKPKNGTISKKEMDDVIQIKEKIDKTNKKLDKISTFDSGCMASLIGALFPLIMSNISEGHIPVAKRKGLLGLSIAIMGCSIVGHIIAKSKAKKEIEQLQKETNNHPYLNSQLDRLKNVV